MCGSDILMLYSLTMYHVLISDDPDALQAHFMYHHPMYRIVVCYYVFVTSPYVSYWCLITMFS